MTSLTTKVLAVAALALAGSVSFASTDAEARGFRGGGFHGGGFHGGAFRHGGFRHGFRPNIRPLWARPGGWHGHRPMGWHRRHVHIGVIGVGAVLPACTVIRRFDPVYGVIRRVTVCN
ncbi:hypothetical protein [Phreatobacter sp.]|uniref:hypothetical protein n=1 Tax=Phreatobacter sp. TaxID=1966341 RepID=UPI003F71A153